MVKVVKRKDESDDQLIRRFRKLTTSIVKSARDNKYHKTDSQKRAEKKKRLNYLHKLQKEDEE